MSQAPINENTGSIDFDEPPEQEGARTLESLITRALPDLSFPLSKQEILARAGERRLRFANGQSIALFDLLVGVPEAEFGSASAVAAAVRHPQWTEEA